MANTFLTILAALATSSVSTVLLLTHGWILIFELDLILLDVFSSEMLLSLMALKLILGEPRIYKRFLNVYRAHLLLAKLTVTIRRLMGRWRTNGIRLLFAISALSGLFLFVGHLFIWTSLFLVLIGLTPRFLI